MLAIGGAPGQAYKAPEVTELTGAASWSAPGAPQPAPPASSA